jgi:16S rRNA (cytosine967-C5)-methyltransferase
MRVLDACAAPGGKTGHLLEQADSLELTALDVEESRLRRVAENLRRLDGTARLVAADAARPVGDWAIAPYDRILADVPCTATGVMRRHPDIRLLRRAADVTTLVQRQRQILDALWQLLPAGGKLLYATCSVLPQENEAQIAAFLERHGDAGVAPLPGRRGIATAHGLQLLPVDRETDGFYYALLEKRAG